MTQTRWRLLVIVAVLAGAVMLAGSPASAGCWRGCAVPGYWACSTCVVPYWSYSFYPASYYGWTGNCGYPPYGYRAAYRGCCGWGCSCVNCCSCVSYGEPCCQPAVSAVPSTPPAPPQAPTLAPPAPGAASPSDRPATPPQPTNRSENTDPVDSGTLTLYVPTDAKVTINGLETKSVGSRREYVSFGLEAGKTYPYTIKTLMLVKPEVATETGAEAVSELQRESSRQWRWVSRTVYLRAGENVGVAFSDDPVIQNALVEADAKQAFERDQRLEQK